MAGALEICREDDCLEYFLFLKECEDSYPNEETEMYLKEKAIEIKAVLASYIQQYIWHKDAFNCIPKLPAKEQVKEDVFPPHLFGKTQYGDNVEDEWFIVYLLMELTKKIEGLVVRVTDSDGEFLLIEAAEFLPCWATPEICEGRVFLYKGTIHIIPVEDATEEPQSPSVYDAIKLIRSNSTYTKASPAIQKAVQARIEGYPEKIRELLHKARAYVPIEVAAVLKARPDLIAPAVLAFCNRDPKDVKVCNAMRYFPPENRVMCNIMFTKCLYAMILHHKYNPDRRTGWNVPPSSDPNYKAHILGIKLACGFEILTAQVKPTGKEKHPAELDLTTQQLWPQYLKSLQQHGYFQHFLEGSKDYNVLLEAARNYFASHFTTSRPDSSSYGHEILTLLGSLDYSVEDFLKEQHGLTTPDDESWLEICPQELDKMLEERYGKHQATSRESDDITGHLTKFLNQISDLEGAEFPSDNTPPARPKRGIKLHKGKGKTVEQTVDNEERCSESGNKIKFDADQFSCAVQNILDFVVPEDSWDLESDGSSMSSYEDEIDMDLDQLKRGKGKAKIPNSELKQYMDQMDRELAATTIGESFEKASNNKDKNKDEKEDDSFDDIESFEPVDIDMNAVKNILESYQAQMGGAGPAGNLLGPMGVRLDAKTPTTKISEK